MLYIAILIFGIGLTASNGTKERITQCLNTKPETITRSEAIECVERD